MNGPTKVMIAIWICAPKVRETSSRDNIYQIMMVFNRKAGLSPRGRGNLMVHPWQFGDMGSIPAWAGEPTCVACQWTPDMVYPRVGGGTS